MSQHACGSQRATLESLLSTWVPGTELRLSGLATGAFICSHLTGPPCFTASIPVYNFPSPSSLKIINLSSALGFLWFCRNFFSFPIHFPTAECLLFPLGPIPPQLPPVQFPLYPLHGNGSYYMDTNLHNPIDLFCFSLRIIC